MIQIEAAGRSVSGQVREINEDALALVSPEDEPLLERKGHLVAIADGLGGHEAGQVAGATAVQAVVGAYFAPTSPGRVEPALQRAVQTANLRVHDLARREPSYRSMQTTLSCLALAGALAYVAHVGDSRVYLLRGGALTQLTSDHSEAAELVRLAGSLRSGVPPALEAVVDHALQRDPAQRYPTMAAFAEEACPPGERRPGVSRQRHGRPERPILGMDHLARRDTHLRGAGSAGRRG